MTSDIEPRTFVQLAHHAEIVQAEAHALGVLVADAPPNMYRGAWIDLVNMLERLAAQVLDLADLLAELHEEQRRQVGWIGPAGLHSDRKHGQHSGQWDFDSDSCRPVFE